MTEQELKQWNKSANEIDSRIGKILNKKGWDVLLPNNLGDQDRMESYYKHIMYVINSFLEEEEETRELFIQLPVEELANRNTRGGDEKQVKRFRWLNGTIAASLQMATIEHFRKNLFVNKETNYEDTINRYNIGDFFLAKKSDRGYFYVEVGVGNGMQGSRLCFYDQRGCYCYSRAAFNRCSSDPFVKITGIPPQGRRGINLINSAVDKVKWTPQISKQYSSATLISVGAYPPLNEHIVIDSLLQNNPVTFSANYLQAINNRPDIIVICGDKSYANVAQAYRNSSAKKIIFIGSVPPFGGNIKTYPFTFRELYRYCSSYDRLSFKEPKIEILSFPWLEERKQKLEAVLDECMNSDEEFLEEDRNRVLRQLICSLSRYDFDANQLQRIKEKYSEDNIDTEFELSIDVSDDTVTKISSWIQSLEYNEENPKAREIRVHYRNGVVLGKNSKYKRIIQGLVGYGNVIVTDNLAVNFWDNRYPDILRYHLFAEVVVLYYNHERIAYKTLQKYIDSEFGSYTNEYRQQLNTNIDIETPTVVPEELPDWWDNFVEDEYLINESISVRSEKRCVIFDDGESDIVDGDVIVDLGEDGYESINIRDAKKGMEISYYKRDIENFEKLISACDKYKVQWEQIIKYSEMWKQQLLAKYKSKISQDFSREDAIKTIASESGLPVERIKAYCQEETPRRFLQSPKEMTNILNYLVLSNLLTEEDKSGITKAKRLNGQIPKRFGRELKKVLFDSFLKDNFNSPFLNGISKNSGLSIDEIFSSAIVQNKKIKSIEIVKNNE